MAFAFKNPIEQVLNNLPSKYGDQILSKTADKIIDRVDDLNSLFSFAMSKESEALLTSNGVEIAPLGFQVHSHPVCKTIENHLIYRVLMNSIKKIPSIALVSMRDEKSKKLIKRRNFSKYGEVKFLSEFNSCIDCKDRYRYLGGNEAPFHSDFVLNKYRSECEKNGWFPKTVFIHDELHFWQPEDVLKFFEVVPETGSILATIVCPPELIFGDSVSRNPRVYTFEKDGDHFHFFPDGVASEGYRQRIETSLWALLNHTIENENVTLRVSVIYSLYAHHLISIERNIKKQKTIFLQKPDALLSSELGLISYKVKDSVIERSTMMSILLYLSCLKNPNKESALAKLRQLEKRDLFPDEVYLVSSLSTAFIKYGSGTDLDDSFWAKFRALYVDALPGFFGYFFEKNLSWSLAFRNFSKEISIKHFKVDRKRYYSFNVFADNDLSFSFCDRIPSTYNLVSSLKDGIFNGLFGDRIISKKRVLDSSFSITKVNFSVINYSKPYNVLPGDKRIFQLDLQPFVERRVDNCTETYSSKGLIVEDFMNPCTPSMPKVSIKKAKNACVFKSISAFLKEDSDSLINRLLDMDISDILMDLILDDLPVPLDLLTEIAIALDIQIICFHNGIVKRFNLNGAEQVGLNLVNGHATPMSCKELASFVGECSSSSSNRSFNDWKRIDVLNESLYEISIDRAIKLAKSISRGSTGILRSISEESCDQIDEFIKVLDEFKSLNKTFKKKIGLILGAPGSGKTFKVKECLHSDPNCQSVVISPRRALGDEWVEMLRGTVHKVFTFESALTRIRKGIKRIILDESSLYPPGYLDLICLLNVILNCAKGSFCLDDPKGLAKKMSNYDLELFQVVMIGDPLQSFYYSELDSILLEGDHDLTKVLKQLDDPLNYLWFTHRMPKGFETILEIKCLGSGIFEKTRFFSDVSAIKACEYSAVLVASHEDKKNLCISILPMTFGEAQGLTFEKKTLIMLTDDILRVSPNAFIVAISRSRVGFDFALSGTKTLDDFIKISKKKLLGYVLERKVITKERLEGSIPCKKVNFLEAFGNLEEKMSNDLFILPELQPDFPFADEPEIEAVSFQPAWFRCHISVNFVNPLLNEIFEKMEAKERREFWHISTGCSEQFPDTDKGLVDSVMGFGFRFDSIFPKHTAGDNVTFWEGVKKRLHFSNAREERRKFEEADVHSNKLVSFFLSKLPERFEVTNEDVEMGVNSFNEKRAQKSEALWKNHTERSDIDWPLDHVFLFMKSQLCTKEEKMFTKAKAGQTLACFQHIVLFRFGPMLRAIERAFIRAVGESYYIHSGKNFFCLNEFVIKNGGLFDGKSIESDYEAFDSCQDALILAFECNLLKRLGVSSGFIQDYKLLKLNLGCRLGSFAIMRFTGEFCTFLFNTFANMLFTFLKYEINPSVDRILFAGDDMCSIKNLRKRNDNVSKMLDLFTLKAKEFEKAKPMFCGWYLTPDGILKSPRLLWARICVMKEKKMIHLCLDNYFLEAVFAYNLGERLYYILSDEELDYHYTVTRFFVKEKKKLSGTARSLAFGTLENFGRECLSSKSMNSLLGLTMNPSRLTPSKVQKFMETHLSYGQTYSIASGDLSQTSRLSVQEVMVLYFLTFSYLIRLRLTSLKANLASTTTCTLGQSLLQSPRSFQIQKRKKELSLYMMAQQLKRLKVIYPVLKLISKKDQHMCSLNLDIVSQHLTYTYAIALEWLWTFLKSDTLLDGKFFQLILELCTDLPIQLGFLEGLEKGLDGLHRQFKVLKFLNIMKISKNCLTMTQIHYPWKLTLLMIDGQGGGTSCLTNYADQGSTKLFREWTGMNIPAGPQRNWLGQNQLKLIIEMANTCVQNMIRSEIRNATSDFLWTTFLNPTNALFAMANNPTEPQEAAKRKCLYEYTRILFGNIAVLGSSLKTQFPNIEIVVPPFNVRPEGDTDVLVRKNINLYLVVSALESHRSISTNAPFMNATFRQVCEAFAPEAYAFLKVNYALGVSTNLYRKWPRAFDKAPWIAFDFCSGLDCHKLTPDERNVMDRLTKRLFRTEGQKSVFEANAEVSEIIEG